MVAAAPAWVICDGLRQVCNPDRVHFSPTACFKIFENLLGRIHCQQDFLVRSFHIPPPPAPNAYWGHLLDGQDNHPPAYPLKPESFGSNPPALDSKTAASRTVCASGQYGQGLNESGITPRALTPSIGWFQPDHPTKEAGMRVGAAAMVPKAPRHGVTPLMIRLRSLR